MNDLLTLQEIEARCQGEWVLIGDTEHDKHDRLVRGRLLAHSESREEVYQVALRLRPKKSAVRCYKQPPEGMEYVL